MQGKALWELLGNKIMEANETINIFLEVDGEGKDSATFLIHSVGAARSSVDTMVDIPPGISWKKQ